MIIEKRPRRVREGERCTDLVQIPVPPTLRADLMDVARRDGYASVAAVARAVLTDYICQRKQALDAPTSAA